MAQPFSPGGGGYVISGRYRLRRKLGAGGTGTVYLADDLLLGQPLALKVLRAENLDSDGLDRLQREFRAVADLDHPHIARAFDFGYTESDRLPYYTREYVPGVPLEPGPPAGDRPRRFLEPLLDLLDALHALHARDLLHLDVHAGNVIVADDATRGAVLIDIGFPHHGIGVRSSLLSSRSVWPPELALGVEPGPSADVHGVGRLLLYRLTGRSEGGARLPKEIPGWGGRLTLELERIIAKAISSDPAQRFASALELSEALRAALGERKGRATAADVAEVTIGREAELAAIDASLERAAAGAADVVWLTGRPGMGKTRLLTETRWQAQLRGLPTVELRFVPDTAASATLADTFGALQRAPGESWLAPLSVEHGGSTRERAARAATAYFAAAGEPLVVIVDDVEHADRESRLLLGALVDESRRRARSGSRSRGLAIVAATEASPQRSLPELEEAPRALRLGRLTRPHSVDLLCRLLRPLAVSDALLARAARSTGGVPLRIRQLALALRSEHGGARRIPDDAELPSSPTAAGARSLERLGGEELEILRAFALTGRASDPDEIAAATGIATSRVRRLLRGLLRDERVAATPGRGARRSYYVPDAELLEELRGAIGRARAVAMHRDAITHLRRIERPDARQREALARHCIAIGRIAEGRGEALDAASLLADEGRAGAALRLLADTLRAERSRRWRIVLAERMSDLHGAAGDHVDGIAVLEPLYREHADSLRGAVAVRLRRRLGVHYHRAGDADRAIALFAEALGTPEARRQPAERAFIQSELAEIHTFRGEFDEAETACRAGLALLDEVGSRSRSEAESFLGDMEVTLRATLGHLELRRMRLEPAREELEEALARIDAHGLESHRAAVLNNLGIVYNQLDRLEDAESCFREAGRRLAASGEPSSLIHIVCNLAMIAAKRGDASTAEEELGRARRHQREHPGERIEFFVETSTAVVSHLLGRAREAIEAFRRSLPLGRRVGDRYMVRFSEIYLAEALASCGQFREALTLLRRVLTQSARTPALPILRRMAAARLMLLARLLGRTREAERARQALEAAPRTSIALLEAWNELAAVIASSSAEVGPESSAAAERLDMRLEAVAAEFTRLGVPAGARLARVGSLTEAIARDDRRRLRELVRTIERDAESSHALVRASEPLVAAEASFVLGDTDRAESFAQRAAGALVGQPFLELDWGLESLRARLAERRGDRDGARHHVLRAAQAMEFLVRSLPSGWVEAFRALPRVADFESLRARVDTTQRTRTTPPGGGAAYGLVGRSEAMQELIASIERLRDVDLPVFIAGATGSGKELVARALHATGPRHAGRFYTIHCASIPAELFESELFGYEAGAFTGAEESRPGLLEHLEGGTLLLDDVTSLPPATQSKLLHVLDAGVVRRLGAAERRPVNVRFFACSTLEPADAIARGALRAELSYRLASITISVPPLDARRDDIELLTTHFLELHARRLDRPAPALTPAATGALRAYDWPGNVRELESLVLRLLVARRADGPVDAREVRRFLGATPSAARGRSDLFPDELLAGRDLRDLKVELERAYLVRLFDECEGSVKAMTERLGVKRSNLYTWLRKLGLDIRTLRRGQ